VTQVVAEVLRRGTPKARVTQVVLEVLREPAGFSEAKRKRLFLDPPAFLSTTLTDFPVRIRLGTEYTDVFSEIDDADYQKIKITTDLEGANELYVEVEKWDATNQEAILWVKRTLVPATRQFLYLWWGGPANTSYVGQPGSTPAQSVWNSNYKVVYHMFKRTTNIYDTDAIADSTVNANHATGANLDAGDYIDGVNGKALALNGTDEYFDSKANGLDPTAAFTAEFHALFNAYHLDGKRRKLLGIQAGTGTARDLFYFMSHGGPLIPFSYIGGALRHPGRYFLKGAFQYHHVVMTYTGNPSGTLEFTIDGVKSTRSMTGITANTATGVLNFMSGYSSHSNPWEGRVDEVRVSQAKRSDDWIKATWKSFTEDWVVLDTEFLTSTTYGPEPTTTTAPPEEPEMEWGSAEEVWTVDDAIGGDWTDGSVGADRNYRMILAAADLLAPLTVSPFQVRVTFRAHSAQNSVITGASIGRRDGSTDDYVAGNFTRLQFGGSNSTTITAGGTVTSDWADLAYDELYDHLVHLFVDAAPSAYFPFMAGGSGYRENSSDNDTMVEDISGYDSVTDHYYVERVEIRGSVEATTTTAPPPVEYPLEMTLTNPGAESGSTTGWTAESGSMTVVTASPAPFDGTYCFNGGAGGPFQSYQEVDLAANGADLSDVDDGLLAFRVEWWQHCRDVLSAGDLGWVALRFKDASRVVLDEQYGQKWYPYNDGDTYWHPRHFWWEIPAGTRYVDVILAGDGAGTGAEAYINFDSIQAWVVERDGTKYLDTFASYTTGQVPPTAQWAELNSLNPTVWTNTTDWTVEAIASNSYGNKGLDESDVNVEYYYVPAGLEVEDCEALMKYNRDSASEEDPRLAFGIVPYHLTGKSYVAGFGDDAVGAGYISLAVVHPDASGTWEHTSLMPALYPPDGLGEFWLRLRRIEKTLFLKIWRADGSAEPTAWTYRLSDADSGYYQTPVGFPGGVGLLKYAASGPVDVFSLCVGVGSADLPETPAAPPTRVSQYQVQTLRTAGDDTTPVRVSQYQVQVLRQQALLFYTTFREPDYTVGSPPPDWTERWDTAVMAWTVEAGVGTSIRRRILQGVYSGPADLNAMSWNDAGSIADIEILARIKVAAGATYSGVVARGAGSDGSESGYMFCMDESGNQIGLFKEVSGTLTQIGSYVSKTIDADTWYFLRFRLSGTSLRARFWLADGNTSEPGTWDFDTTDSSVTAAGWAGVVANNADMDVDYFAVGTNGNTPPVPDIGMQRGVVMIVVT
jgi:hypothetical protein